MEKKQIFPPTPPSPMMMHEVKTPSTSTPQTGTQFISQKKDESHDVRLCKDCWYSSRIICNGRAWCEKRKFDTYINSVACADYDDTPVF